MEVNMNHILQQIKGGLIVSCQALEDEPLHSSFIMARMAVAAQEGGAVGIRANSVADIREIKESVKLPLIGIVKTQYPGTDVFITPTRKEVDDLAAAGAEIIAMDATGRKRPGNVSLDDFFKEIRRDYPQQLFMADCSTLEEGIHADRIGFDIIGTTLAGYTPYTEHIKVPNLELISQLRERTDKPIIAEGGIWSGADLQQTFRCGAFSAVIGAAITRPQLITKYYVKSIENLG